jgi:hypothetical protein
MRPSRCQYCGGNIRSPHALGGHMVVKPKKSKLFVRRSNNRARGAISQALVNHPLGHFVHRIPKSFSPGEKWAFKGKIRSM